LEIVEILLEDRIGADLDLKDNNGKTALMWAAGSESPQALEIVNLLLELDADLDLIDSDGNTAYDLAKNNPPIKHAIDKHREDKIDAAWDPYVKSGFKWGE